MPKGKLRSSKAGQVGKSKPVSRKSPARTSPQKQYAQSIKRIVRKLSESKQVRQANAKLERAAHKKQEAEQRLKSAKRLVSTQREVTKSARREYKLAKSARSKALKDARAAEKQVRKNLAEIKKNAKGLYKLIGKKRPTGKQIETAVKERKSHAKRRKIQGLTPEQIISQAIKELQDNGPGIAKHIVSREFDKVAGIVKITIKGKDYSRKITGRIVERTNSSITKWKWTTEHEGRRSRKK